MKYSITIFLCSIGVVIFNIEKVCYFFGYGSLILRWACLATIIVFSFLKIVGGRNSGS